MISLLEASNIIGKTPNSLFGTAKRHRWEMTPGVVKKGLAWKIKLTDVWDYALTSQSKQVPRKLNRIADQWTLCPTVGLISVAKYLSLAEATNVTIEIWLAQLQHLINCKVLASTQLELEAEGTYCYTGIICLQIEC